MTNEMKRKNGFYHLIFLIFERVYTKLCEKMAQVCTGYKVRNIARTNIGVPTKNLVIALYNGFYKKSLEVGKKEQIFVFALFSFLMKYLGSQYIVTEKNEK